MKTSEGIVLTDDHKYYYKGKPVPGVNEILDDLGFQDKRFYKPEYAARGRLIHQATEVFDKTGEFTQDEELRRYVVGWAEFLVDHNYKWDGIEYMAAHPKWGYAGTIDRLCGDVVVDIKSGSEAPWHKYQITAYALMVGGKLGVLVYLDGKGSYKKKEIDIPKYEKHWEYIIGAYKAKHYA